MKQYQREKSRPISVLLATADTDNATRLATLLSDLGFLVQQVNSVSDLDIEIGHIRCNDHLSRSADVIVSDDILGQKSVLTFLAKKHLFVQNFPVIILAKRRTLELVSMVGRLGIAGLLKYPIESKSLHEAVHRAIMAKNTAHAEGDHDVSKDM